MAARDSLGMPPRERPSYFVWQEGEPPDVVWEFGVLTVKGGAGKKKETYRGMGGREYWLVDPVGGYHDPRLQGFQLLDGAYERLPWKEGSDGMVTVWSPLLQLKLRFANRQLRFWDRETAQYLELPEDEAEGWVPRDAEARAEKAERDLEAEKRARKALEERIAALEAVSKSTRDAM